MAELLALFTLYFQWTWATFWAGVGVFIAVSFLLHMLGVKQPVAAMNSSNMAGLHSASRVMGMLGNYWVIAIIALCLHIVALPPILKSLLGMRPYKWLPAPAQSLYSWDIILAAAAVVTAVILFFAVRTPRKKRVSLQMGAGFADIGGYESVKDQIRSAVGNILSDKGRFKPNGILLFGPPGCGKTFFAGKTAEEFKLPFIKVHIDDIKSKWVNESAENVGKVFREAIESAPCVLFFDEMDGVVTNRKRETSGHFEDEKTTDAFLTYMDDIRKRNLKVVVVGATNFYDKLDKAAVRRGRFDYHIKIDRPDKSAAYKIIHAILAGNMKAAPARTGKVLSGFNKAFGSIGLAFFVFFGVSYSIGTIVNAWRNNNVSVEGVAKDIASKMEALSHPPSYAHVPSWLITYGRVNELAYVLIPLLLTAIIIAALFKNTLASAAVRSAEAIIGSGEKARLETVLTGVDINKLSVYFEGRSVSDIENAVNTALLSDKQLTTDMVITTDKENKRMRRNSVPSVPWSDLILNEATMGELKNTSSFIAQYKEMQDKYTKPLKGIMLYGEPGCGKTLIARAMASNTDCAFFPVKSSDILRNNLGGTEGALEEIYAQAREAAPSIVFIDEAESLFERRDTSGNSSAVTQILAEIEGFADYNDVVFTVIATNYPDKIDSALKSRMARSIHIPRPDSAARLKLFKLFISKVRNEGAFDYDRLADMTEGSSARDVENLVNKASAQAPERALRFADFITAETNEKGSEKPTLAKKYSWDDLIVGDKVMEQLKSLENIFKFPDKARKLGIKGGLNAVFTGPPGTGKTYAARILAGIVDADFKECVGGDFKKKYVGETESMIADTFKWLRGRTSAILFIDEAEGLLMDRGRLSSEHSVSAVTQFLAEMQGFEESNNNNSVIIATNIPDSLDPAVKSRFPIDIQFDLPGVKERVIILALHLKGVASRDLDLYAIAQKTDGYSGRDIVEKVIKAAKMNALNRGADTLSMEDFNCLQLK